MPNKKKLRVDLTEGQQNYLVAHLNVLLHADNLTAECETEMHDLFLQVAGHSHNDVVRRAVERIDRARR